MPERITHGAMFEEVFLKVLESELCLVPSLRLGMQP